MSTRQYSELQHLRTYDDRFAYLKLDGEVGRSTFGFDRYINQQFYTSREWRQIRASVIIRDHGCDLGILDYEIYSDILVHHMNPVSRDDILKRAEWIFDPEYLITTTYRTHNAIHFGGASPYPSVVTERTPGDTRLW